MSEEILNLNETCRLTSVNQTEDNHQENKMEFIFEVVLLGTIGLVGILGNTTAIILFVKKKDKVNFHRILTMLIMFDNILVFLNLIIFLMPHLNDYFRVKLFAFVAPIIIPMAQIAVTGSIYSTVAISIERYMISCKPFFVISHNWSSKRYIIPTIVFSIAYNLPKFFELKTGEVQDSGDNTTAYILEGTNLRLNYEYFFFYAIWMNFILMGLIPFIVITVLNSLTVRQVVKQMRYIKGTTPAIGSNRITTDAQMENSKAPFLAENKRRQCTEKNESSSRMNTVNESQLTLISTIISIMFIICHGVRWIPNIYELVQISHPDFTEDDFMWPLWVENVSIISHFLITLNSSINFYVYYASRIKDVGSCLPHICLSNSSKHDQEFEPSTNVSRF